MLHFFGRGRLEPLDQTPEFQATQVSIARLRRSAIEAHIVARGIVPELKGLERSLTHDSG